MRNGYYILNGKEPVEVDNVIEWAERFDTKNRVVKQTTIGEVKISTVFLGLDHSFGEGAPLLFETMIFGGKEDGYQERYSRWDEAEKGHDAACEIVKNS